MKQNSKFFVTDFAQKRSVLSLTPCLDSYFSLEYRRPRRNKPSQLCQREPLGLQTCTSCCRGACPSLEREADGAGPQAPPLVLFPGHQACSLGKAGSRGRTRTKQGCQCAKSRLGCSSWPVCASWLGQGTGARGSLVVKFTAMSRISKATGPLTQGPSWDGAWDNLRSIFHRDCQLCGATQACAVYNLHGCSQQPCCN